MFLMPERITKYLVCGHTFSRPELRALSLEKMSTIGTPPWEREIWSFILKWFSNEKSIEVTTSGSTGKPKPIELTKEKMSESAKKTIAFFKLENGNSALLCLPVKYIAGKMMIVRALVGGLNLEFVEPGSCPDLSGFTQIDFAAMTPMQAANMVNEEESARNLQKVKKLILGGSALPLGLEDSLQDFENEIWQTYGMTETITHIALRKVNGKNHSEWYQTLPGVKVEAGENDRLQISYPGIGIENMLTNDVVEFNKNGQFKLVGRFDSVVNSGGVKLFPESIEKKIENLFENAFFLTGIPDEILGERLVLVVEGVEPDSKTYSTLMDKLKTTLSGFEVPKEIIFLKTLKRTGNGKLIRDIDF
jgi:O-succinylbenzoic acid--CoA ligase